MTEENSRLCNNDGIEKQIRLKNGFTAYLSLWKVSEKTKATKAELHALKFLCFISRLFFLSNCFCRSGHSNQNPVRKPHKSEVSRIK